jgi:hypothetical protein
VLQVCSLDRLSQSLLEHGNVDMPHALRSNFLNLSKVLARFR